MKRLPFRSIEPFFCAGLCDDPLLLVRIRPLGKNILFDCGQIHHLAKRIFKSLDALFITHAHMDHFMGIDTLIRNVHVSPRTIHIYGPPGITQKLENKLRGYDWNLTEPTWSTFITHDIFSDHIVTRSFPGPAGFTSQGEQRQERTALVIYENDHLLIETNSCDHKIPSLMYRLTEKPPFAIDAEKMAVLGLVGGDWLRLLKQWFYGGTLKGNEISVLYRHNESIEQKVMNCFDLYTSIHKVQTSCSIGYVTDIGFTSENVDKLASLLTGVTLLVCECSFLAKDQGKARSSHHLCTSDVNALIQRLRPRYFLPVHLSKNNLGKSQQLYSELQCPPGTVLLNLPERVTPRPLLPQEMPHLIS